MKMKINNLSIQIITASAIYSILHEFDHITKVFKDIYSDGSSTLAKIINQTELAVRANIPKSTLSRMLANLEKRGLIIRYKNRMSNIVKLSDI